VRTHAEYATAWLPGEDELPDPPLDPAAVELVVDVFDVCEERLATPPLGDVPPQPATSRPRVTSAAVREAARVRPPGVLLRSLACFASPCMSSPLQLEKVVLWAACTRSTVSGAYRRPGGGLSAGETVLKPPGSSLEHTPDPQRSPAGKEE